MRLGAYIQCSLFVWCVAGAGALVGLYLLRLKQGRLIGGFCGWMVGGFKPRTGSEGAGTRGPCPGVPPCGPAGLGVQTACKRHCAAACYGAQAVIHCMPRMLPTHTHVGYACVPDTPDLEARLRTLPPHTPQPDPSPPPPRAAGKLGAEGGAAAGAVVRAGGGVVNGAARMLDMFGCAFTYDRKGGR